MPLGGGLKVFSRESTGHLTAGCRVGASVSDSFVAYRGSWLMKEGSLMPKLTLGGNPHFSVLVNGVSSLWV